MAGSRVQKIGTVFTRVSALLKSGAMQDADRPVWYDVYRAFPPRTEQRYNRPVDPRPPADIVYREDTVRAEFYRKYSYSEAIDLTSTKKYIVTRFVDLYNEIKARNETLSEEEIFKLAAERLQMQGVVLETKEEKSEARKRRETEARKEWGSPPDRHTAGEGGASEALPNIDVKIPTQEEVEEMKKLMGDLSSKLDDAKTE